MRVIEFKPQLETTISRSSNQYWMKEHVTEYFGIGENSGNFPLLEHRFKLKVHGLNVVFLIPDKFSKMYDERDKSGIVVMILQLCKVKYFNDVIRTIISISDAVPFNYAGVDKIKRTVILEDYEDKSGIVVMILQLCKVKYFNEKPSVTPAMYSTKLYINNDIREIAAFRKRYSEKEGFDPENHSIVQFTSVKKEVTVEDLFRGGVKMMVGHIRDSASVCSSSTFSRKSYSCTYTRADIDFNFSESLYTTEFLNTIKMSGIPHHKLVLKIGAPVMCMRNIDQRGGLCNGTRLQVLRMSKINIECKIISGGKVGTVVAIPRMNISPSDKKMPFQLNRRQFPVALCFAMTINKSQGQTLSKVGLFLEKPVFSHGQLYVAVSRVKSKKGLKVLCCDKDGNYCNYTTNVVFKEVLHRL
ncbi:ATP-dependent DNA helicase PIF1-like protein [Tanacetum coccineum]